MSVIIGHASHNELGSYTSGVPGDSTGTEVATRSWYSRPWTHVIRCNDSIMREKIANAMERACLNNKIGYAQNTRNTLLTYARKVNYDPKLVTTACNTDCSALVSLCCIYAGIPESILVVSGNSSTTSNIRNRLMKTGKFTTYTSSAYVGGTSKLLRGDILLCEGRHVAVCLSNGTSTTSIPPIANPTLKLGNNGTQVGYLQRDLNYIINSGLVVDSDFGKKTESALMNFQNKYKLVPDGIYGSKSYTKVKEILV